MYKYINTFFPGGILNCFLKKEGTRYCRDWMKQLNASKWTKLRCVEQDRY